MTTQLGENEVRALEALAEQIIPREGWTDPQFVRFLTRDAAVFLPALRRGLEQPDSPRFKALVTSLVAQCVYSQPYSWPSVGFDPAPKRPHTVAPESRLVSTPPHALAREYDAIVVGAGAGGGIVAAELAAAGRSVLLLERGEALTYDDIDRDHLRNHRFSAYGHNTGPGVDGNPRVLVRGDDVRIVRPFEIGWHNNAMTVGGGTRVWGGHAWRFAPPDFRMATVYGTPEGSSLADWPFDYDELAPYYARAEREIGVSGAGDYPMPPLPANAESRLLSAAAARLGWRTSPVPLAINSTPYDGRASCVQCGTCVGFACPSNAKNGTHNTVIPRALATSRCTLATQAHVARVLTDSSGVARGVEVFFGPEPVRIDAATIVLSAGAIETARLLLLSGIGNRYDQVGRSLQGHLYAGASGVANEDIQACEGPGVSIATCEFSHGNPGVIGGGMIANEFVPLPIFYWTSFYPRDLPRHGVAGKRAFEQAYRRRLVVMGPIQEIPNPDARVTLDPQVRDGLGLPVARLSGVVHPESVKTAQMLERKAHEWLAAADAKHIMSFAPRLANVLSGGQHQAGTCRMGMDPTTSVTDPAGRVHGQRNLWVADASLHPTNGGFNPALTVMANAYRVAASIVTTP